MRRGLRAENTWRLRGARRHREPRSSGSFRWNGLAADDERHARRATAADIERGDTLGAVNLVVASVSGYLPVRVEHLTGPGGAHRVAAADQAATRIDRHFA